MGQVSLTMRLTNAYLRAAMIARTLVAGLALLVPPTLRAQNVAEVQVAPPSVTIKVGERTGLLATAFDRIGNVIPTVRVIWSSNNVQVARVDNDGTVSGVAGGGAVIEARGGARQGRGGGGGGGGGPPTAPPPPGGGGGGAAARPGGRAPGAGRAPRHGTGGGAADGSRHPGAEPDRFVAGGRGHAPRRGSGARQPPRQPAERPVVIGRRHRGARELDGRGGGGRARTDDGDRLGAAPDEGGGARGAPGRGGLGRGSQRAVRGAVADSGVGQVSGAGDRGRQDSRPRGAAALERDGHVAGELRSLDDDADGEEGREDDAHGQRAGTGTRRDVGRARDRGEPETVVEPDRLGPEPPLSRQGELRRRGGRGDRPRAPPPPGGRQTPGGGRRRRRHGGGRRTPPQGC